jgi:hypothetical protein
MCPNTQRSISKRFAQEIMTSVLDDQTDIEEASESDADLDMCGTCCVDYIDRIVASGAVASWIRCWETSIPCCKFPDSAPRVRHTNRVSNFTLSEVGNKGEGLEDVLKLFGGPTRRSIND